MMRTSLFFGSMVVFTAAAIACSTEDGSGSRLRDGAKRVTTDPATGKELPDFNDPRTTAKEGLPDPLEGLKRGADQNAALCARVGVLNDTNPNFNAVTNAVCNERRSITNIKELLAAVGLAFTRTDPNATNGSNGNPGFALSGHSSSLVGRTVSAINPRAFVFSPPPGQPTRIPGYVAIAFTRGEPFVEIAAESPRAPNKLSFYLFKFELACEAAKNCQNGDLLTPAVESNWKGFGVYDDEDLKNTLVDCRHCHQPDGPSSRMMLRMQELEDPWTHWFRSDRPGGRTLLQDYFRAHPVEEEYAGIPGALISKADGRALEDLVKGQGFAAQPNAFNSQAIEAEVKASAPEQPAINKPPGKSTTWQAIYDQSAAGNFIPVPYHDVKVTDPDKLQFASDEYRKLIGGQSTTLPDIRRVFLNEALEEMTFLPRAGASGRDVLVQSCAQCHNAKLDQTISRAKFDVTRLDSMSRAEKDVAIARLNLPSADRLKMPPASMRSLPDDARNAAIQELRK
jgi:hypothetical protein